MQPNVSIQGVLECRNIYQMYFALCVLMINLAKVNNKAVILALVEAHLSFSGMKRVQLRY